MFLVAEIGINHNGDLNIAKKLIEKQNRLVLMQSNFKKGT